MALIETDAMLTQLPKLLILALRNSFLKVITTFKTLLSLKIGRGSHVKILKDH